MPATLAIKPVPRANSSALVHATFKTPGGDLQAVPGFLEDRCASPCRPLLVWPPPRCQLDLALDEPDIFKRLLLNVTAVARDYASHCLKVSKLRLGTRGLGLNLPLAAAALCRKIPACF